MELSSRRPYIQPAGFVLRLLLIVQLIASPFAYVQAKPRDSNALSTVQRNYATYSAQPFDETKANEFLKSVSQNQAALQNSADGKLLLAKASRARLVLALKRQLDKCFGGDILQLEAGRLTLTAAMNSEFEPDCTFSNSALESLDGLSDDLAAWIANDNSGAQTERRSALVKALFTDTALRAADAESRLRYLFKDPVSAPELLTTMCGANFSGCPKEFVASFRQRAEAMKQKLKNAGYQPLTASEIAQRLNSEMRAMFDVVYDPSRAYHAANFAPERWSALAPGPNDPPEYTRPVGEARLTFQPYPNALTHPGQTPERYQELADQLDERYRAAIPEEFYQRQSRLRADEYGIGLATSREWMHALGHGSTIKPVPFVMGSAGVMMGMVSTDRGPETALPVDQAMSLITDRSVRQNRDQTLERLNATLGEMGARVFSTSASTESNQDDLQKLLIANPRAAGELLLRDPKNADLYCEAFLAIQREEKIDKYLNWGLLGLTIGAAIVTGGASLLGAGAVVAAGGATLAAVGAVDIVYGVSEGFEQTELGQLQHATCVSEGPTSSACQEYQSTLNSAMASFALAGIGVAGSGPFLKTLGRLSHGSVRAMSTTADEVEAAARFLRANPGRKLTASLSEEQKGELLAYLSQVDAATRARLAAHIDGLSDSEAAAFARKLLEDLRAGKNLRELSLRWSTASPAKSSDYKIPAANMDSTRFGPLPREMFPQAKGPDWAPPMYDPSKIVRDTKGRPKIPNDYGARLIKFANLAEEAGFDTVIRKPGKNHKYNLLCFNKGPQASVLGRVVNSKGAGGTTVCVDPFSENLGTFYENEDLVTLSWDSFGDALTGRGYVLLHEMGHVSMARRAVKEGQNGVANESYAPYGRMGVVKDQSLVDNLDSGLTSPYLETGFEFDELHSFNRQLNQMISDATPTKRSPRITDRELTVPPDNVDGFIAAAKQNAYALNHFSNEALAAFRKLPEDSNIAPNGITFEVKFEYVVVDKKRHKLTMLSVSKPLTETPEPNDWQQMTIMIPPGSGDDYQRIEKQLERLRKRSYQIFNDTVKQEEAWERVKPKP